MAEPIKQIADLDQQRAKMEATLRSMAETGLPLLPAMWQVIMRNGSAADEEEMKLVGAAAQFGVIAMAYASMCGVSEAAVFLGNLVRLGVRPAE